MAWRSSTATLVTAQPDRVPLAAGDRACRWSPQSAATAEREGCTPVDGGVGVENEVEVGVAAESAGDVELAVAVGDREPPPGSALPDTAGSHPADADRGECHSPHSEAARPLLEALLVDGARPIGAVPDEPVAVGASVGGASVEGALAVDWEVEGAALDTDSAYSY